MQSAGDLLGLARLQCHGIDEHAAVPAADEDAGLAVAERGAVRVGDAVAQERDADASDAAGEEESVAVVDRGANAVDPLQPATISLASARQRPVVLLVTAVQEELNSGE